MARLIVSALCSLDGYMADEQGDFSWAQPDAEVHAAVNALSAGIGTMLLGRRMYEVLAVWETLGTPDQPAEIQEFAAVWLASDKIVHSSTIEDVSTTRTSIVRRFDAAHVARLKQEASRDLSIGGPTLAAAAFQAGLVDEVHLFVSPVIVGGGLRALPDDVRLDLTLIAERRFEDGTVHLGYAVRR